MSTNSSEEGCPSECKKCKKYVTPQGLITYQCHDKEINNSTTIIIVSVIGGVIFLIIVIIILIVCIKKFRKKQTLPKRSSKNIPNVLAPYRNLKAKSSEYGNIGNQSNNSSQTEMIPKIYATPSMPSKKRLKKKKGEIVESLPPKNVKFQSGVKIKIHKSRKSDHFTSTPHLKSKFNIKRNTPSTNGTSETKNILINYCKVNS